MSAPSPFDVGRAVGGNISGAFQRSRERSAIDDILTQASESNDPAQIDQAMRQILRSVAPERQQAAMGILQGKYAQIQAQKQNEAYQRAGLDPHLPESINKELIKKMDKGGDSGASLQTIGRMREIQGTGHLGSKVSGIGKTGRKAGSTFSKEGSRLRAEYERLGKSLIQQSTNIPIRNRQEFEILAHDLYDYNKSNEEIVGTLDAMERIIRSASGQTLQQQTTQPTQAETQNQRPPLESFRR